MIIVYIDHLRELTSLCHLLSLLHFSLTDTIPSSPFLSCCIIAFFSLLPSLFFDLLHSWCLNTSLSPPPPLPSLHLHRLVIWWEQRRRKRWQEYPGVREVCGRSVYSEQPVLLIFLFCMSIHSVNLKLMLPLYFQEIPLVLSDMFRCCCSRCLCLHLPFISLPSIQYSSPLSISTLPHPPYAILIYSPW